MRQTDTEKHTRLDFIVVGPFKTGTTWIDYYLRNHPQVALPNDVKETFFYSNNTIYSRGNAWLGNLFDDIPPTKKCGEVGPSYFSSESALDRIYKDTPGCKIICSFREPASRLYSFYLHQLQRGDLPPKTSFLEALEKMPLLLNTAKYGTYLSNWQDRFGKDNVIALRYEDITEAPQQFADQLCAGLGVETLSVGDSHEIKVNETLKPLNPILAKIAYETARILRRSGMHRTVSTLRDSPIRQMLFSPYRDRPKLSDYDKNAVYTLLEPELALFTEKMNGRSLW